MKISIITVCRNDLKGLNNTFESIRTQDCEDLEWWVIDGDSTDGTVEWLRDRHRLEGSWLSEPDNGIYDAMNKGIGLAAGDYLLFMNSGDMFAGSEVISKLIHHIKGQKTAPDFVYGDAVDVFKSDRSCYRNALPVWLIKVGMIARHQSMLYRKEAVRYRRYPLDFRISADYAFTARLLMEKDLKILKVDFPICRFFLGGRHDALRIEAMAEDFEIRRTILKENLVSCVLLFCGHWLHHSMKRMVRSRNCRKQK